MRNERFVDVWWRVQNLVPKGKRICSCDVRDERVSLKNNNVHAVVPKGNVHVVFLSLFPSALSSVVFMHTDRSF